MFEIGITLGFTVVSLLVSYLYLKHCQRVRPWREREEAWEWDGQVFDVTPIKPAGTPFHQDVMLPVAPNRAAPRAHAVTNEGLAMGEKAAFVAANGAFAREASTEFPDHVISCAPPNCLGNHSIRQELFEFVTK